MVKSAMPGPNVPPADQSGNWSAPWYQYFQSEHARTGGNASDLVAELGASVDDVSASGLFSVTQGATSSGALATILLQVRAVVGGVLKAASIKISALTSGSRIEIDADDVLINGTVMSSGGILSAHLETDAATQHVKEDFSGLSSVADTAFHSLTTGATTLDLTGGKVEIDCNIIIHNSDAGDHPYQIRFLKDGSVLKSWPASGTEAFTAQKTGYTSVMFSWHDTDTGTHVYKVQQAVPDSTPNLTFEGTLRVDEIKR